jgi:hypothetical protein
MSTIPYGIMYGTAANTTNRVPHRLGETLDHAWARRTGMINQDDAAMDEMLRRSKAQRMQEARLARAERNGF